MAAIVCLVWLLFALPDIWRVLAAIIGSLIAAICAIYSVVKKAREIYEFLYDLTKPWRTFRKQFRYFYRDVERYRGERREPWCFYRCPTNIDWADVFAGRDYPRRRYVDEIVKLAKAGELVAILGKPFSGKSAIMMRAAVELLNEGYSVFELRSDISSLEKYGVSAAEILSRIKRGTTLTRILRKIKRDFFPERGVVLVIDNIAVFASVLDRLPGFLRSLQRERIGVIMTSRLDAWERFKGRRDLRIEEIRVELSEDEVLAIAKKIVKGMREELSELPMTPPELEKHLSLVEANPEQFTGSYGLRLLIRFLTMGVKEIYEKLEHKLQYVKNDLGFSGLRLLGCIAAMTQFEISAPRPTLVRIVGDKTTFKRNINNLVGKMLVERRGDRFRVAYHAVECRLLIEILRKFGFKELELYRDLVMNTSDVELKDLFGFLGILMLLREGVAKDLLSDDELRNHIMDSLKNRRNADLFLAYSAVFGLIERYKEALECAEEATKIEQNFEDAWVIKGSVLDMLGRHEEAIECYDKAIEINPKSEKAWASKGAALGMLGRRFMEEAEKWKRPKNEELMGEAEKRIKQALECFKKAIEINPQDIDALNYMLTALDDLRHILASAWERNRKDRMGEIAKYTKYYDIIIEVKPDHAQAWFEKALTLIIYSLALIKKALAKKSLKEEAEKTLKEALKCLKKTTELDPKLAEAWYYMGMVYLMLDLTKKGPAKKGLGEEAEKTLKEVLKCLKKTTELNPELAKAWYNMGMVYLMLDEESEVERCLEKLAQLDPKLYNYLLIALMEKRREKAIGEAKRGASFRRPKRGHRGGRRPGLWSWRSRLGGSKRRMRRSRRSLKLSVRGIGRSYSSSERRLSMP